jgi:hypothetical protein
MACCSARPPEYRRVPADRIPELIPLLVEVTAPGESLRSYRCRQCGQMWQQHDVDGEALVVQVGWANRARPAARPTPPPRAAAPQAPPVRARRGGFPAVAGLVVLAVVFFLLTTLPPFVSGSLAGGAWVARWIVGALLVLLAAQTLVDAALRRRRASGKRA